MSVYQLTHTEAWALATALHLPVQPGSALADWLHSAPSPDAGLLPGTAFSGLAAKGYYRGPEAAVLFDEGLLKALTLISVNAALLTALIRTNGRAGLTRFAQAGESIVQVGMDEAHLSLHDVVHARSLAQTLLPSWFTANRNEGLRDTLPLGAFLLFNHACTLADWAFARSDFQHESFPTQELLETFQRSAGWLDIFNATGVRGVPALAQLPLETYLNLLITGGYLVVVSQGFLTLGNTGKPLAVALTAPESCTLTLTLQTWEEDDVPCGAFLHGGERLFLLEFVPGQVNIQQLGNATSGRSWIEHLLEQGSRAHYAEYLVPSGTAAGAMQRVPVPIVPPAPVPQATCTTCGSALTPGARFCPNCGAPQGVPQATTVIEMPSTSTSAKTTMMDIPTSASGKLVVLSGPLANQEFLLDEAMRLGRELDNDLTLLDGKTSRYHALIQRQGGQYQITDLGSSNGTWVNGDRIAGPTALADGDSIFIGETKLTFNVQS